MCDFDSSDLKRLVDVNSDFGTRAADSADIGSQVLKRNNIGARRQPIVERRAHHRKCRASVDERIANQHSVDHCFREQMRRASTSRRHSVTRLRLRFCRLCWLLTTGRRAVSTEMFDAKTCVASTRRFSFSGARQRDVAEFATLETDCRVRYWFRARAIRLRRLRGGHNVSWARVRLRVVRCRAVTRIRVIS